MALNTLAANSTQQKTFYDRVLLERMIPKLIWLKHGRKRTIPKNEGQTIDFRRFNRLATATTPLTEGITPSGSVLSITNVTAVVNQYGDYVVLTDAIDLIGIDPVVTETLDVQGEQAGETLDEVVRNVVVAGTNVFFVGGGSNRGAVGAGHVVTGTVMRRVRQIMARNNAKPYPGTRAYLAFIHPDVAFDIMGDAAWANANIYANTEAVFDGEIGKMYGVKYIESTLCPIFAGQGHSAADVYGTIVIGDHAYGVPDIAGKSKPETIVKGRGSAGTADPLNQRSSCGWVAWLTAVRLDELCILRVESIASVGSV